MSIRPKIIQGGMGAAISNWRLARAVSKEGQLGVVSGTALATIFTRAMQAGDPGGHIRRAVDAFPVPEIAQRVFDKYYHADGMKDGESFKRHEMYSLKSSRDLIDLTVLGSFVEVFLAKEGHDNPVGINVLEKIQMPNLATIYGAMLAGVSCVIVGAGIPLEIPGALDTFAQHQEASLRLDVKGAERGDDFRLTFDPQTMGYAGLPELNRPEFFAIISSNVLATAMIKRATGRVDGFVVETPTAGGHNAPPRGPLNLNEKGEPIYGEKDVVNLEKLAEVGLPFWMAGSYGSADGLQRALESGAQGIQVGTAFAYCEESGMAPYIKEQVLAKSKAGTLTIRTDPKASPTGFPFKLVELENTLRDDELYALRERICDLGYLRHPYKKENGTVGYRCPSEPVDHYVKKGGDEADTVGRKCLCNGLAADAGFPQTQKNGYVELPLVTSGDEVLHVAKFLKDGQDSYSAADVIERLLAGVPV